jgi:site-specific DNA-methyltransferase (adenine-specific)
MVEAKPTKVKTKKGYQVYIADPAQLIPYENNPRLNDEAVEYVVNSIKRLGFRDPIEVDENFVIVCGHTRQKAALQLGLKEVPIIIHHFETEEEEKMYRLANNKVGEMAGWDFDKLDIELEELDDLFDTEEFGFYKDEPEDEGPEEEDGTGDLDEPTMYKGDGDKSEFILIVTCGSKMAQEEAYDRLVNEGFLVRKV